MDFAGYIKKAIEVCKFNPTVMDEVARDPNAFTMGLIFLAIGGVASALWTFDPVSLIMTPVFMIVGFFIGMGLFHLIAGLFGGRGEFMHLFRTCSIGSVVYWPSIIPLIGWIVSIWMIPIAVVTVERTYKLDRAKAILVVIIPMAVMFVLAMVGMLVFGFALWSMLRG